MRYLLLFILFFLILRLVSHAYLNRPSMRGSQHAGRNRRENHPPGATGNTGRSGPSGRRAFQEVEDADYEIIEEESEKEKTSGKS